MKCEEKTGSLTPPTTISNLLAGLFRYCKKHDPRCPNFMNRKDPRFSELTGTIQVKYRELREAGIGADVKHASVVTPDEEDILWKTRTLGDHNPVALQRAVFFYVGKAFCL